MTNELEMTTKDKANAELEKFAPFVAEVVASGRSLAAAVKYPEKKSYFEADEMLAKINRAILDIDEKRKTLTRPLDFVKDEIMAAANLKLLPLKGAKEELRLAMQDFARAEIKHKRDEEARLDAEAKKKAEDERIALAAKVEAQGNKKAAEDLVSAPVPYLKPKVETAVEQARSSAPMVWLARLTDPGKFIEAVARAGTWPQFIEINEAALNRMAARTKGPSAIPGVEFYEDVSIRSGR